MRRPSDEQTVTVTKRQQRYASWVSSVLIDIVVLNLFVEHAHAVVIDSFSISILAAVLMKLMLDAVVGLERRVKSYFDGRDGTAYRVLGAIAVFSILFCSKFVILEAVIFVFGDHVQLGHFIEVAAIVITMLLASRALQEVYVRLGRAPAAG
jgi:cation transport ATPase